MTTSDVWHFFGVNNSLAKLVKEKLNGQEAIFYSQKDLNIDDDQWLEGLSFHPDKRHIIFYTWGNLTPKRFNDQSLQEINKSLAINTLIPIKLIEKVNNSNCEFRMLYVSSESAKKGSYDGTYFIGKASVEAYIRELRLKNTKSSLVAIAPSTILDAGMTERREDQENVKQLIHNHPKKRLLLSQDVADACYWILQDASDYISNTVIEMNGGKFTRMT